ncbi:MAG: PIG-L family deacetylase [Gemmatimonadetes bacterium]|jgi:LmbE family N-acetylglucosaminyl deacetylase|nr:PIG-L family deacetylase [Gemmatimonadota bacterium]MBT4611015.1 PIG-L family deacetylase [Gemmatimonadota bacterium]MBT5060536.1 PIG-L family deacetylase [Gemmatimonadota bacterium]MBT5142494.1 PIG-L family deacetylase [Gemmatimonadota bacterium]MBT5586424.1 PIG-L family deacetylase [Gemmatimonadota bacterium]
MNILAIGAHPDDVEYGCAGTLIQHVQRGDNVYIMIVTDGAQGGDPLIRREEQLAAAKIIGATDTFFGDYGDTQFECHQESIMAIEAVINKTNADSVYTHFGEDTHQDHRHIARAVVPAARSVRNLLFFEGLSSQHFDPSVFVDIGDVIHQKLGALEAHASQISRTNIEQMNIVNIAQSAAHFRGIQGRVTHAEGFVPVRYFM